MYLQKHVSKPCVLTEKKVVVDSGRVTTDSEVVVVVGCSVVVGVVGCSVVAVVVDCSHWSQHLTRIS